jgi:uncharacterized protein (DUF1778 family)
MALKTERIEARAESTVVERIRMASEIQQTSLSTFVVEAAMEAAERVLESNQHTLVPDEYFDMLIRALDSPSVTITRLEQAAQAVVERPAFILPE